MRGVEFGMLALLASACNAAFDLAPTISIDGGADFDEDGLLDAQDNCPTVANPDQANADDDAFGDACDSCPTTKSASVHDEDGDFVGDACDVCPAVRDFQDDTDGDGVGDLCDPDLLVSVPPPPRMHRRLLFEAFETVPADWQTSGVAWTSVEDSAVPVSVMPRTDRGLVNPTVTATGTWLVGVGFHSTKLWTPGDQIAVTVDVAGKTYRCEVSCAPSGCGRYMFVDGALALSSTGYVPRARSRLRLGAAGAYIGCNYDDGGAGNIGGTTEPASSFSVAGSPNVGITYIEVIQ
jgi:hypothetical protein